MIFNLIPQGQARQLACIKSVRHSIVALLSAMLAFSATVHAQTSAAQTANNANEAQVTLNLQDVDIRVLINTVAEVSGKNFVVDPRVKGKVSVISGAPLGPDQLYDVFLSILEVHNFATVTSGSVIKVLPSNVIKQRPTPFREKGESNDAQVTQIIQLKYVPVQDLVPIIRPLIPPTSHFAPHVPSNSVVLTDTAANIQRVLEIIKRIDIPDKRSNVRVVYLKKTKATDLASTLAQIVASSADPATAGNSTKVSIQALDSINALIINATDDEYAKLQALVDELDIERELEADISVIYLKHAKADDLVSILNDVTKVSGAEGVTGAPLVQADEATNALIVKATGSQLQTMRDVIDQLDIRRAQVLVETVIAEVSLSQAAALGVTWNAGGPNGTGSTTDADGNVTENAGVGNLINRDNPSQIIGTAEIGTDFGLGSGGLTYSLLDFKKYNLDVVINALRADTNSNVLSTPTILTLDNEEAEIVVGQEVPFITGRFVNTNNNNNNNNNQINGNSGFQNIERKDVGIKLKIKPQISDGDTIQLEVLQEISSVATEAVDGQADLITNRRSIDATVQVDDGQVIVLGGLIQDDVIDVVSWVPILGKIPLIGYLFRSKSKTAIKRNLMVFLKPRIIRSADQMAEYSKMKYDEVRRDTGISRENSSDFLIKGAEPPVLDKYENVINEGILGTERRRDEALDAELYGIKKRKGLNKFLPRKRKKLATPNSGTDELKEALKQTEAKAAANFQTDGKMDDVRVTAEPIEWDKPVPSASKSASGEAIEQLDSSSNAPAKPE